MRERRKENVISVRYCLNMTYKVNASAIFRPLPSSMTFMAEAETIV